MTGENIRLFFAVNLEPALKQEIAEKILPLIPKDKWRKVLPENLHVTMQFLGHLPREAVAEIEGKVSVLKDFESFEADLNCAGHFGNRVLWLGFGKGTEEFNLLNSKLQQVLETHDERFHAHVTLARNRGEKGEELEKLVEKIRKVWQAKRVWVKNLDLMKSQLQKSGPKYSLVFSTALAEETSPSGLPSSAQQAF